MPKFQSPAMAIARPTAPNTKHPQAMDNAKLFMALDCSRARARLELGSVKGFSGGVSGAAIRSISRSPVKEYDLMTQPREQMYLLLKTLPDQSVRRGFNRSLFHDGAIRHAIVSFVASPRQPSPQDRRRRVRGCLAQARPRGHMRRRSTP